MGAFEKRRLGGTGLAVDTLGFGCASLGNLYHPVSDADARKILDSAWSSGFRYYDTAPHYGQGLSERRVGDALRRFRGKDYVLSTKVGRLLKPSGYAEERHAFLSPMPFDIFYDYSYDGIMRSFEDSLQRLGLDRIDILYMHDIGAVTHGPRNDELFPIAMDGGYRAMDELRASGSVSAIGLGVNEFEVCEAALDHGNWDCFLLAGRYTLLEQEALNTFLPRCVKRNCSIVIGGAYNSGILATGVRGSGPLYYNYEPAPARVVEESRRDRGHLRGVRDPDGRRRAAVPAGPPRGGLGDSRYRQAETDRADAGTLRHNDSRRFLVRTCRTRVAARRRTRSRGQNGPAGAMTR